jgi:hypothetical protein
LDGGIYTDIDRLVDTPISEVIPVNVMCVLPTCLDYDFTHDFMMSEPQNPIFAVALNLNLTRRREGYESVYHLGPQTWMHAVTKCLVEKEIDTNPGEDVFKKLRQVISASSFIHTYRENPPLNNVLYRNGTFSAEELESMKRSFYAKHNMKHWSGEW